MNGFMILRLSTGTVLKIGQGTSSREIMVNLGKTAISVGSGLTAVEHDDALLGKCRL